MKAEHGASSVKNVLGKGNAPLYHRLADTLMQQIESGKFKKGDIFPGDVQLSAEYGVSLITVRAAMQILKERGLVVRYAGKGSFVRNKQQPATQWGIGSIDDLITTDLHANMTFLKREMVVAPDWVREKFSVPPRTKVYWFRTARDKDGVRFLFNDIYLPLWIGERISQLDFDSKQIQKKLRERKLIVKLVEEYCGMTLSTMHQTMSAEAASADTARILDIKSGHSVLVVERDYFSSDGVLIQVTRSRYRLSEYRYSINVARISDQ
jgi:GntR family transcriptional regulator